MYDLIFHGKLLEEDSIANSFIYLAHHPHLVGQLFFFCWYIPVYTVCVNVPNQTAVLRFPIVMLGNIFTLALSELLNLVHTVNIVGYL